MTTPLRIGCPMFLTIDQDARLLLQTMQPNSKGRGCFVSELIRKEARERTQRAEHLATLRGLRPEASEDGLAADLEGAGTAPDPSAGRRRLHGVVKDVLQA